MANYKHLFFDLDNTLLDFTKASHKAFAYLVDLKGYTINGAYSVYKRINKQIWTEFEDGLINSEELRKQRFTRFLGEMSWDGDGEEWNRIYLNELSKCSDFVPGAKEYLNRLTKYFEIHIITNGLKEVQWPRLNASGITAISKSITISDEIGVAKPQYSFFEIAHHNANYPQKKDILVIGDNYDSDITGANIFGLDSCWLNQNGSREDRSYHKFEIKSIQELDKYLF